MGSPPKAICFNLTSPLRSPLSSSFSRRSSEEFFLPSTPFFLISEVSVLPAAIRNWTKIPRQRWWWRESERLLWVRNRGRARKNNLPVDTFSLEVLSRTRGSKIVLDVMSYGMKLRMCENWEIIKSASLNSDRERVVLIKFRGQIAICSKIFLCASGLWSSRFWRRSLFSEVVKRFDFSSPLHNWFLGLNEKIIGGLEFRGVELRIIGLQTSIV